MKSLDIENCLHIWTMMGTTDDGAWVNECMDCMWHHVLTPEEEKEWNKQ